MIGRFETIAKVDAFLEAPARIGAVTVDSVAAAARRLLPASNRTVGYFDPLPIG